MIIKRRLQYHCQSKSHIINEDEIKNMTGPIVIIGEPGSGKTTLASNLAIGLSSQYYSATDLQVKDKNDINSGNHIIVDGLDEISRGSQQDILGRIIRILPENAQCIFTCRTADWNEIGVKLIKSKFNRNPQELILFPLNTQEIFELAKINLGEKDARKLIMKSREDSIYDLLSNPLMANLLMGLWINKKWPRTKSDLFDKSTLFLASENNEIHRGYLSRSISIDTIIEGAGYVFSLMLLADVSYISLLGEQFTDHHVSNFNQKEIPINEIMSTKLFRPLGDSQIVPFHRSIAEYLAAKWIASRINENKISLRRLESALYGDDYGVPSGLRGLHAWIACLVSKKNKSFIERDPYGIFRYGDATLLGDVEDSRSLLRGLRKAAEYDPYISAGDYMTIGRGIARIELKSEILEILCCDNPILAELVIRSLIGFPLVDEISSELEDYLFNTSNAFIGRCAAFMAIISSKKSCRLDIVKRLSNMKDEDSLRIALDEGCRDHIELFEGRFLGNLLGRWHIISNTKIGSKILGIGYRLHKNMLTEQIREGVKSILTLMSNKKISDNAFEALNNQLIVFINELKERKIWIESDQTWKIIKQTILSQREFTSLRDIANYISGIPQYKRREIQFIALIDVSKEDTNYYMIHCLNQIGLTVSEDDANSFLEQIRSNRDSFKKPLVRTLVSLFINNDKIINIARSISQDIPDLLSFIDNITQPLKATEFESMVRYQAMQDDREKSYKNQISKRHNEYKAIRKHLLDGNHLQAALNISNAYLGLSPCHIADPNHRVINLVGNEIYPIAISSISKTIHKQDVPSARTIAELDAKDKEISHLGIICLAHCAIELEKRGNLIAVSDDIMLSALATCYWDRLFGGSHKTIESVKKELRLRVYGKHDLMEKYVRDTIEPYLESDTNESAPGLLELSNDSIFTSIAGKLAIEWLDKFLNLSSKNLDILLKIVVIYEPDELISIITDKINSHPSRDVYEILMRFAFLFDFENQKSHIKKYIAKNKNTIWNFSNLESYSKNLNSQQIYFLLNNFIDEWPEVNIPSKVWREKHPFNATRLIWSWVDGLANDLSDEAADFLEKLCNEKKDSTYISVIKSKRSHQKNNRISKNKIYYCIKEIKSILISSSPESNKDLQSCIIDALEDIQDRIRGSTTNRINLFWHHQGNPQCENFCRDRLMEILEGHFEYRGIQISKESASVNNGRVDIKIRRGKMIVPIEIKGQWHRDIWSAAESQLVTYADEYGADGYGIYLVLWFGETTCRKTCRLKEHSIPKNKEEMDNLLRINYTDISHKTKIFVMDLSRD